MPGAGRRRAQIMRTCISDDVRTRRHTLHVLSPTVGSRQVSYASGCRSRESAGGGGPGSEELPHTKLAQQLHQQAANVQNAVQAAAALVERQQQQWRQQHSIAPSAAPLMLPAPGAAAAHGRGAVVSAVSADAALHAAADKLLAAKRAQLAAASRLAEQVLAESLLPCLNHARVSEPHKVSYGADDRTQG